MKRKPKLTQAEQSRRFLEAAREAGVDESEGVLENMVRKMVPTTKTFTASTEAEARKKLVDWKREHPKARVVEKKMIVATGRKSGASPRAPKSEGEIKWVTIPIEYEDD